MQPLARPKPLNINWIGLRTVIDREVSRMMTVPIQSFMAPWISALFFIFVFGYIVGGRISAVGGHDYVTFVLPGVVAMNIINISFVQSSSAIYFSRFLRYVEEALITPLSYSEMIVGSLVAVVFRSTVVAIGILVIGLAFQATTVSSFSAFLFWVISVSVVFGLLGTVVGLWARNFEQLNILGVFFIGPLSMVGGVFNTTDMLPPWLRWLSYGNPIFYFVSGLRQAMLGESDASQLVSYPVAVVLMIALFAMVSYLYSRGYGLRE